MCVLALTVASGCKERPKDVLIGDCITENLNGEEFEIEKIIAIEKTHYILMTHQILDGKLRYGEIHERSRFDVDNHYLRAPCPNIKNFH